MTTGAQPGGAAAPGAGLAAALQALAAAPGDPALRLAFHAALSAAELCLWLDHEPAGPGAGDASGDDAADRLTARVFALDSGPTALAFDSEAALADFAGEPVPYAALPGRVLVAMLAGAGGTALLVQVEGGAAELLPPEALAWLARALDQPAPVTGQGQAAAFSAPALSAAALALLVPALERRLSGLPGLGDAVLAGVHWRDGRRGTLLALTGLPPAAEAPVARAVAEALELSGAEAVSLDVVFPAPAALAPISATGLRLNPAPWVPPPEVQAPVAPGLDPARPPKLR